MAFQGKNSYNGKRGVAGMNNGNLKPYRSVNEARENGRKGGITSGKKRRERKALKEELLLLLEKGDMQENICLALINKALSGDVRAFEMIRDTIGEKPSEKIGNDKEIVAPILNIIPVSPHNEKKIILD